MTSLRIPETILFLALLTFSESYSQLQGTLFRRVSRASNFEFAIYNSGQLWWVDHPPGYNPVAFWPRGSFHLQPEHLGSGPVFLAKKSGRYVETDVQFINYGIYPFGETVPGRIGDPKAGYDPVYHGAGWQYVDDPNYIVYSSLDFDSSGVDISGSNFDDWPIRSVNGSKKYVAEPSERHSYPPVYASDEEMFCIFKDTDRRYDWCYNGPNGPSVPIGLEFNLYVYSWGSGPGKDIVLFQYDIINKSGTALDSCYFAFYSGLELTRFEALINVVPHKVETYTQEPRRNLAYLRPINPETWPATWSATPVPPTIGYPFLETPRGYSGMQLGLTYGAVTNEIDWYTDTSGNRMDVYNTCVTDSIIYRNFTHPEFYDVQHPKRTRDYEYLDGPVLITGPFPMANGDTARATVAFIFSDSLPHLLLLDDFITKVYNSGFQGPIPPPPSKLTARGLDRSVKLSWDNFAESAKDPIIPDSLGKPFYGYRLLRASSKAGPYTEIGRWTKDSIIVHEYLDKGTDIGGLKNNVRYYYQILSFDEGAKLLKLDPMESRAVDGVNAQSVVPSTEPSNAASQGSGGSLLSGTLGDVSAPKLVPLSPTNFNNLMSGQTIQVKLSATTDGVKYYLPVTFSDSLSGRLENDVIDPNLFVDGSASIAGIKEGEAVIHDLFSIGATDIHIPYRFEQLSERYHIVPIIEASDGADVPIILDDSLKFTGINSYSPYTSAAKEVILEFTSIGVDTASTVFLRYIPYLNVTVTDVATGLPATDWQIRSTGARVSTSQSYNGKASRYYLSGTLSNGEQWEFGSWLSIYQSKIAFDLTDRGVGSGKTGTLFLWASSHKRGTRDFQVGDKVDIKWQGGVKATFPQEAVVTLVGAPGTRTEVTGEMMEKIRIVPNPYLARQEAERGERQLYFNYLPDQCTIRIYTIALDLVKTIYHQGGSREVWNLQTEGGQIVASQMFFAYIESANGAKTIKKFSVIVGK